MASKLMMVMVVRMMMVVVMVMVVLMVMMIMIMIKPAVMFQSAFKIGKLNLLTKSKGSPWLFFTWPSSSPSPSTISPSSSSFPGNNGL